MSGPPTQGRLRDEPPAGGGTTCSRAGGGHRTEVQPGAVAILPPHAGPDHRRRRFVGANLAVALAERHPDWEIVALDNLKRRGSELNLPRLARPASRSCTATSASPRDLTGSATSTRSSSARPSRPCWPAPAAADYLVQTNLSAPTTASSSRAATARRSSSSRPAASTRVAALEALALRGGATRASSSPPSSRARRLAGRHRRGRSRSTGARTLYGATKLAAELLVAEYASPSASRRRSTAAA